MGKPAARSILDKAGHVGPITVGSPNVIIGGAPAARKGDSFICTDPQHGGTGTIIEGSKTVLINGVPAARMGDKTDCAAAPAPAPVISGAASDQIYNATFAKNINEDKTVKTSKPDNAFVKAFYAEAAKKDKTGDGNYDYVSAEAEVLDFTIQGMYTTEGGYDIIGGGGGMEFLKIEGAAGAYGSNGMYGGEANAAASMAKGNLNMTLGDSDIMQSSVLGEGEVLSAEAKAKGLLYSGGDESRWGYDFELGAEAQLVKGDLTVGSSNPFYDVSGKVGGKAGGAGGEFSNLAYVDFDDKYIRTKFTVALEIGLGGEVEFDISLKWGWLSDLYDKIFEEDSPPPIIYGGTIISGIPKVLIGG